jgi:hypothetical protein
MSLRHLNPSPSAEREEELEQFRKKRTKQLGVTEPGQENIKEMGAEARV